MTTGLAAAPVKSESSDKEEEKKETPPVIENKDMNQSVSASDLSSE